MLIGHATAESGRAGLGLWPTHAPLEEAEVLRLQQLGEAAGVVHLGYVDFVRTDRCFLVSSLRGNATDVQIKTVFEKSNSAPRSSSPSDDSIRSIRPTPRKLLLDVTNSRSPTLTCL